MCLFPQIDYRQEVPTLAGWETGPLPGRVRAMRTLLVRRNLIPEDFVNEATSMIALETEITGIIDNCDSQTEIPDAILERVFHLIQIWGGLSGRGIYVSQPFEWTAFSPIYCRLINTCRSIAVIDDRTCTDVYEAINAFLEGLRAINYKGLGVAFITKHAHFWTHKNLPDNMLPIYDNTFARNITREGDNATLPHLLQFWEAMRCKAEIEGVGLTNLERMLFGYYSR